MRNFKISFKKYPRGSNVAPKSKFRHKLSLASLVQNHYLGAWWSANSDNKALLLILNIKPVRLRKKSTETVGEW